MLVCVNEYVYVFYSSKYSKKQIKAIIFRK